MTENLFKVIVAGHPKPEERFKYQAYEANRSAQNSNQNDLNKIIIKLSKSKTEKFKSIERKKYISHTKELS